ncbi:ER-derived vesicles protein erv46 [Coemansia erecta]|uniref:ER-derived vesicles protein erv46 n=1 Tax=Coemansia asiatica TaxID=1052880 RepID=A0A9W7XKB8_9FUNG|nr:ER-derived vesicles protein erv46 [Coemansia asiatica]KAJ2848132.1 ER-derived vesicles protein erv46 [Coemansia erecta]KAJ2878645.1 ER-derived vesicles protein erv46 [Coemansia asiatica]
MARFGRLAARLQRLDAYAKPLEDFSTRTLAGGMLTIAATLTVVVLVGLELLAHGRTDLVPALVVDRERSEKMQISFDITLPHAPCAVLGVAIADAAGELQANAVQHVSRTRLASSGALVTNAHDAEPVEPPSTDTDGKPYCGSCYGGVLPDSGCCNTCAAVHEAYSRRGWAFTDPDGIEQCVREGYVQRLRAQEGEGCRMHGFVDVNKVAGALRISGGETVDTGGSLVHRNYDYMPSFDFSHTIHALAFGRELPGQKSPLSGVAKRALTEHTRFQYFVKVVGSEIRFDNGTVLRSNEYAATEFSKPSDPGLHLMYDISPMRVVYTEHRRSLSTLLTSICAIVGGITTVASLVDASIFRAERALRRKRELGKHN